MYWKMQFCCSPRVWHLHAFLKPHRGFLYEPPSLKGGQRFQQLYQRKMTNARQMGGGWARLELTEPLSPVTTAWGNYHPWRGLSPLATPGITWIISHYYTNVQRKELKSDLLSIFGLLHLLPLFLTNILVQFFAFSKELWVGSIKSQVESCCFSLFSN